MEGGYSMSLTFVVRFLCSELCPLTPWNFVPILFLSQAFVREIVVGRKAERPTCEPLHAGGLGAMEFKVR